jgi:hypothetical protein
MATVAAVAAGAPHVIGNRNESGMGHRRALELAFAALAVSTVTAGCAASSGATPTRKQTPAAVAAYPSTPVWGFVRSVAATGTTGAVSTPPDTAQAGSWRASPDTKSRQATVTRLGVGSYRVIFPMVGVPDGRGAALVTGIGDRANCHPEVWEAAGRDEAVTVDCQDAAGVAVDARFSALYTFVPTGKAVPATSPTSAYAYLRDDEPSAGNATPPAEVYLSTGNATGVSITRHNPGEYSIDLIGAAFTGPGNNFQVNAIGNTRVGCVARGHDQLSDRQRIFVVCALGKTWTDSRFILLYTKNHSLLPAEGGTFGYAWSALKQPDGKAVVPPANTTIPSLPQWSANSAGGKNTIRNIGVGRYAVTLAAVAGAPDTVQVTPYGDPLRRCAADAWVASRSGRPGPVTITVSCVDTAGKAASSLISLAYVSAAA